MAKRPSLGLPLLAAVLVLGAGAFVGWILLGDGARTSPAVSLAPAGASAASGTAPMRTTAAEPATPAVPETIDEPDASASRTEERISVTALGETELAAAIWVEGRVVFPEGTPAGEEVTVVAAGKRFASGDVHRASVAPDGSFRVAFSKETRRGRLLLDADHLYLEEKDTFDLRSTAREIRLEAALGGCIRGVVIPPPSAEDANKALADKKVRLFGWSPGANRNVQKEADVDQSFRFALRGIPSRAECRVELETDCWAPAEKERLRVAPGETLEIELAPILGARISGRVVDENGASIDGASVQAENTLGMSWRPAAPTGPGAFTIVGIEPGEVIVRARKKGFADVILELGALADGDVREGVDIPLARGESLAGRVVWPDGSRVARARVQVEQQPELDSPTTWECGEDGSFLVTGLGAGPFTVTARGEPPAGLLAGLRKSTKTRGTWEARRANVLAGERALELVLHPPFSLAGRVVDDLGAPLPEFTINARSPVHGVESIQRKFESADGSFVLEGLSEGDWSLAAQAKEHVTSEPLDVSVPTERDDLVLVLPRLAVLSGTVVDAKGEPIARAIVRVERGGHSNSDWTHFDAPRDATDGLGRFEIDDAPTGSVSVTAGLEGFVPSEPLRIDIAPAQRIEGLTLTLGRGGRLTGEVRAGVGSREIGRDVNAFRRGDSGSPRHALVDSEGRFSMESLPPGDYQVTLQCPEQLVPERAWMPSFRSVRATIREGETAHVIFGAASGIPVEVTGVVRRGSDLVPGARIRVNGNASAQEHLQLATSTDANGRYSFELDTPGSYAFGLEVGSTRITRHETIPEVARHVLDFDLSGGTISGRVLDPAGAPFAGAQVSIRIDDDDAENRSDGVYGSEQTGDDGSFTFDGLPSASYTLVAGFSVLPARYAEVARSGLELPEGGSITGVDLALEENGSIRFRVTTASGAPVSNAWVSYWNEDELASNAWPESSTTDGAGRCVASGVRTGTWSASARSVDSTSDCSAPIRVDAGEPADVELVLRPGTKLRILVEDQAGKLVGAGVSVRDAYGREYGRMRDDRGVSDAYDPPSTTVGPLAPGTYRVTVSNHDGVTATQDVSISGEAEREVRLRLGG